MEACGGSHFLGRALREQGHEVRLMPAQYVKPYVKTNKSDYIDAEAIAEAVGRPTMRFVPIKTDDQLDLQSLHPVRERWGCVVLQWSTRFVACCWSEASLCGRDGAIWMQRCRGFWKTLRLSCRAQCACCLPEAVSIDVSDADTDLLESIARLVRLLDCHRNLSVFGLSSEREVLWRRYSLPVRD